MFDFDLLILDKGSREIEVQIWEEVYFLELFLKGKNYVRKTQMLHRMPLKVIVIYDPDYDDPLLIGTSLVSLRPEAAFKICVARWLV